MKASKMIEQTDIFLWANNTDGIKGELNVELFLFNKNFTPYSTSISAALNNQINPIFVYDLINFVNLGAGTGLSIRELESGDEGENILHRIALDKVGRAETLLHLIENERKDIIEFNADEHDFKRVKGVIARFTHPTDKSILFYAVKLIQQSTAITGSTSWAFRGGKFDEMNADVALKMPADNQVLIIGGDLFAFDTSKFEKLFNYNEGRLALARAKGAQIDKLFKLSMPTTISEIAFLVEGKPSHMKKLIDSNPELMTQEQLLEIADEMQVELMTDDAGAIILMDSNDVGNFLDILNDSYVRGLTGNNYLAKSKKPIETGEES
jgi:hypothetical protein